MNCKLCSKPIPRQPWESPRKHSERVYCGRACAAEVAREASAAAIRSACQESLRLATQAAKLTRTSQDVYALRQHLRGSVWERLWALRAILGIEAGMTTPAEPSE